MEEEKEEEEEGAGSLALKGIELYQLVKSTAHIWSSHRLANWHLLELVCVVGLEHAQASGGSGCPMAGWRVIMGGRNWEIQHTTGLGLLVKLQ